MGRHGHPITIRGVTYPSTTDAARSLGVCHSAISQAKARGYLDTVGLNPRGPERHNRHVKLPVTINSVRYATRLEAARALGVHRSVINALVGMAGSDALVIRAATARR